MHVTKCVFSIGVFAHELLMSLRNIYSISMLTHVSVDLHDCYFVIYMY